MQRQEQGLNAGDEEQYVCSNKADHACCPVERRWTATSSFLRAHTCSGMHSLTSSSSPSNIPPDSHVARSTGEDPQPGVRPLSRSLRDVHPDVLEGPVLGGFPALPEQARHLLEGQVVVPASLPQPAVEVLRPGAGPGPLALLDQGVLPDDQRPQRLAFLGQQQQRGQRDPLAHH